MRVREGECNIWLKVWLPWGIQVEKSRILEA